MRNKIIILLVLLAAGAAAFFIFKSGLAKKEGETIKEMRPFRGNIEETISTTATVLPKNRLEIKPPVNGRVESVLVKEGERIKAGQNLAWLSSTERAALLDASRGKGEGELKYWQEVYKPIPLISPIDAEVIVSKTQPGQAVTTSDPILVLSDQLIVRAQVDETDMAKVRLGQSALVSLDAYADTEIKAGVEHIYYESKTVNNVTVYEVDLQLESPPAFLRSGMNATAELKVKSKSGILLLPQEAVQRDNDGAWVLIETEEGREPQRRKVELGVSDQKNVEIISGVSEKETAIIKTKKYSLPKASAGSNPFMPRRR